MIRVVLPGPLLTLARIRGEVLLEVPAPVTEQALVDALEARYPALHGTVRDPLTLRRRAMLRFFACGRDLPDRPGQPLPEPVTSGREPLLIVGAIAGG